MSKDTLSTKYTKVTKLYLHIVTKVKLNILGTKMHKAHTQIDSADIKVGPYRHFEELLQSLGL